MPQSAAGRRAAAPRTSTPSHQELADWLAKDGQLLIPLVELVEKGGRAIDEVIDVMGRATVEAVLRMSASWLEREWPSAAASLREGLAELFTVNRLGLRKALRLCLTTTSIIDSSHSGVRRQMNRVTRWRNEEMAVRWAAVTFRETEKRYRRLTG